MKLEFFYFVFISFLAFACSKEKSSESCTNAMSEKSIYNINRSKLFNDTVSTLLQRDSSFIDWEIDTTARWIFISDNELIICFVKLNKVEDSLIVCSGYVGLCMDTQYRFGKKLNYFSEDMIELSDSTCDKSIRLLKNPRFQIRKLTKNDGKELFIKERVFNGTFYHAVITHVFQIDTNTLDLIYKYSVETICWLPMSEKYIIRIPDENGDVCVYLSEEMNKNGVKIGSFSVENSGTDFNIKNIRVYNMELKGLLITSSPTGAIRHYSNMPPNL